MGKKKDEKIKIDWNFIFSTTFNIIICCLLLIGVLYFGFVEKYQAMWGIAASFAFIIFILNIEKFEEFKIGKNGFEAKMKQVIDEAYATLESVKIIAKVMANFQIDSMTTQEDISAFYETKKNNLFDILEVCKELNLMDDLINKKVDNFFVSNARDFITVILTEVHNEISQKDSSIAIETLEMELYKKINNDRKIVSVKELQDFFETIDYEPSSKINKEINEYKKFIEYK